MKFTRAYKDALKEYSEILKSAIMEQAAVSEAIPAEEAAKAKAEEDIKAAATAGNEAAYKEAKTEALYHADRLSYLNARLTALEKEPLADRETTSRLLAMIETEAEQVREEFEKSFVKQLLETLEAAENILNMYEVLGTARQRIRLQLAKENGGTGIVTAGAPQILFQIEQAVKTARAAGKINLPEAWPDLPGRLYTKEQAKDLQAELSKWGTR